jgi:hypothetical protein
MQALLNYIRMKTIALALMLYLYANFDPFMQIEQHEYANMIMNMQSW